MLAFKDSGDGYYEFAEDAPPEWYAGLIPTERRLPPPVVRDIAAEIDAIERQYLLARPVRDVLLPLMEAKAAELGYTPAQLRIANPGYRRVKELDEQIAALRALM